MSIADKISRLSTAKTNIANAITAKGGTVSAGDGYEDFATDIGTIPAGITPSGSISITENGTHDVTNYASAAVNVSSSLNVPIFNSGTRSVNIETSGGYSATIATDSYEVIPIQSGESLYIS